MIKSRLLTVCLSVGLAIAAAGTARAQDFQPVQATQDWLNSTATQGTIKPGTVITTQNWTQYQQFMPLGMQRLFSGQYFWKIPPDVAMTVGPTKVLPLPKTYMEASEKYGSQTSIGSTPSGHHFVANYVAGQPFPNPQEPNKGYKILANVWFSYVPNLYAQPLDHPGVSCTVDRFGSMSCSRIQWIYRQTGYNTDPDVQQNLPQAGDVWFTEWFMVLQPEQSKYTTNLTLFHKNPEKYEDDYVFVPALRRSLRLAVSARCAPAGGSDFVLDDYKTVGFDKHLLEQAFVPKGR